MGRVVSTSWRNPYMDATNNKTITGVFVALLLGSVFVGTLTASADIPNPTTGLTAVAVDAKAVKTSYVLGSVAEASSTWPVSASDAFSGANLTYNNHYDVTVFNISTGATSTGYGYGG